MHFLMAGTFTHAGQFEKRIKLRCFLQYINTPFIFKDYGTDQYLKLAVFLDVPPYSA